MVTRLLLNWYGVAHKPFFDAFLIGMFFPQLGALRDSPVIVHLFGIRGSRLFDEGGLAQGLPYFLL